MSLEDTEQVPRPGESLQITWFSLPLRPQMGFRARPQGHSAVQEVSGRVICIPCWSFISSPFENILISQNILSLGHRPQLQFRLLYCACLLQLEQVVLASGSALWSLSCIYVHRCPCSYNSFRIEHLRHSMLLLKPMNIFVSQMLREAIWA